MKIAVLISGGVDSSVALHLARQQYPGAYFQAFYLKIWLEDDLAFLGDCPWDDDLLYAREVCESLAVPLQIVPLQSVYYERVVEHALRELRAGCTPSPDILCNQRIKFGAFLDFVDEPFDLVVTGHYAQVEQRGELYYLLRSPDVVKDQTYFLSSLDQKQLARACFPIGALQKREVRHLAAEFALPNRDRKDSQGICFLGKIKYVDFVRFHLGEQRGDIIDRGTGRVLGSHLGYWFHTVGQRRGLGLSGGPWYVCAKDVERNVIFVSHQTFLEDAVRDQFEVAAIHWIGTAPTVRDLTLKIRHGPDLQPCTLESLPAERWLVTMSRPDSGVAPGQYAIFYLDSVCLGNGVIQ
jgi:tRNA (5-methylaminomethyl-2-thiouridylate)-methyltransferase